jgi:mRNA interferase MazF
MIWRSEVHLVDLGQPIGHEPALARPAVVVSSDLINNGPGETTVVVPVASIDYGPRSHIEITSALDGLDDASFARCDQVRGVSTRRIGKRLGEVTSAEQHAIDEALRFILDL